MTLTFNVSAADDLPVPAAGARFTSGGKIRTPTEKQTRTLLNLGSGSAGLSWGKRMVDPMLNRGWVSATWDAPYYQWVRITPDGLRALALGIEKFGLPDLAPRKEVKVCYECEREWNPKCKCGSRRWRYEIQDAPVPARTDALRESRRGSTP